MDSRDKKYAAGIDKALVLFDSLDEWADYIAFLSKLLKALQQKHTTEHWIPHDLAISIRLSKCLSPILPSGVHSKTLELYNFIFAELGTENLGASVNIWIPGILPIMQFASISIKPLVIDLYNKYVLALPEPTLKNLAKPLLTYLLPSIDDERSEFFDASLALVDTLQKGLNDDSLFWQSIFLITVTSEERRLGCLVWFNKRLPDLNIVIPPPEDAENNTQEHYKSELRKTFSKDQLALITPEPGILIRAFISALESSNLLIQRGFFDLLIKKLQIDSTVLQKLSPPKDLQALIMSVIHAILKKDMSINRRVWNWLLGPETTSALHLEYFHNSGSTQLVDGLLKLINGEYDHRPSSEQKIQGLKITLASMDRWEIGSELIPNVFIPALRSVKSSLDCKAHEYEDILKSGSALFDAVETLTIYSNIFVLIQAGDTEFVNFILQNFNVQDEEMIVHQLPLILIAVLVKNQNSEEWMKLIHAIMSLIPQRAYLPVEHASEEARDLATEDVILRIEAYYNGSEVMNLPFQSADLSMVTSNMITRLVISNIRSGTGFEYIPVLNKVIDAIPELKYQNDEIVEILHIHQFEGASIIDVARLFTRIRFPTPVVQVEILKTIVYQLCVLLKDFGDRYQVEVVKTLHFLTLSISNYYVEAAVTSFLLTLESFGDRLKILNYLWTHSVDTALLDRPLHIILDEFDETNGSVYTVLQGWIEQVISSGTVNTLFQLITAKLHESLDDDVLFTYHVSILHRVLLIDVKKMLNLLKEELTVINSIEYKNENVSTYKDFTLFQLNKFLRQKSFDAKCIGTVLKLYELLLDGSESWFEEHVTLMFHSSKEIILTDSNDSQYEMIVIVLFDHLTHLTKLLISKQRQVTDILVKTEGDEKPFVIDFLISTFERLNNPGLLNNWIALLSASLKFQDEYIFKFVEPIAMTIIQKINVLYNTGVDAKDDTSISLLLTELQEVLSLFRTYVITIEINSTKNSQNDPGFFSTMAGVFNSDSTRRNNDDIEISENRRMISDCFREAVKTSFNIWKSSDGYLKSSADSENSSIKYQALKLKHKSKFLMESLYEVETVEVMKTLISNMTKDESNITFKVLQVLDGSRPQRTIPYIFKLLNQSIENKAMMRPTMFEISEFLLNYTDSLQDDTMEDIFDDSVSFLKTVSDNMNSYKPILLTILKFISVLSSKINHLRFGSQKKVKKELSDAFIKIYPTSLNFKNADIVSALTSSITDSASPGPESNLEESTMGSNPAADVIISQEDIIKSVGMVIPHLKHIVFDTDKQQSVVSAVLVTLLTPSFKSKHFPSNIMIYHLELLKELITYYPTSKSVRFLISELFNDGKFFDIKLWDVSTWNTIISKWLSSEPNDKISDYLTKSTQSTTNMNIFTWNENEQHLKKLLLKRVAYMILIGTKDNYIVLLKGLFAKLDSLLEQNNGVLNSEIFLVIRVVVLKFSEIHLYDYWTFIYTALQRFFLGLLDAKENFPPETEAVLHACKLLDLLLVLKIEDFQEWIFIIDTINAIYKNAEIISLIDKISLKNELFRGDSDMKPLVLNKSVYSLRVPALLGVKKLDTISYLKPFFDGISYYNFENVYNCGDIDYDSCEQDIFSDLFNDEP
jgi:hypothetical protein